MRERQLDGVLLGQPREVLTLLGTGRSGESERESRERGEED